MQTRTPAVKSPRENTSGEVPAETYLRYYEPAKKLISDLCLSDDFTDFLTLPAYDLVS